MLRQVTRIRRVRIDMKRRVLQATGAVLALTALTSTLFANDKLADDMIRVIQHVVIEPATEDTPRSDTASIAPNL